MDRGKGILRRLQAFFAIQALARRGDRTSPEISCDCRIERNPPGPRTKGTPAFRSGRPGRRAGRKTQSQSRTQSLWLSRSLARRRYREPEARPGRIVLMAHSLHAGPPQHAKFMRSGKVLLPRAGGGGGEISGCDKANGRVREKSRKREDCADRRRGALSCTTKPKVEEVMQEPAQGRASARRTAGQR